MQKQAKSWSKVFWKYWKSNWFQ